MIKTWQPAPSGEGIVPPSTAHREQEISENRGQRAAHLTAAVSTFARGGGRWVFPRLAPTLRQVLTAARAQVAQRTATP